MMTVFPSMKSYDISWFCKTGQDTAKLPNSPMMTMKATFCVYMYVYIQHTSKCQIILQNFKLPNLENQSAPSQFENSTQKIG